MHLIFLVGRVCVSDRKKAVYKKKLRMPCVKPKGVPKPCVKHAENRELCEKTCGGFLPYVMIATANEIIPPKNNSLQKEDGTLISSHLYRDDQNGRKECHMKKTATNKPSEF